MAFETATKESVCLRLLPFQRLTFVIITVIIISASASGLVGCIYGCQGERKIANLIIDQKEGLNPHP